MVFIVNIFIPVQNIQGTEIDNNLLRVKANLIISWVGDGRGMVCQQGNLLFDYDIGLKLKSIVWV